MSEALSKGMVLVMSLWDDDYENMHQFDSVDPAGAEAKLGGKRGECPVDGGSPARVEAAGGSASVTFSNVKFGDMNSTYSAGVQVDDKRAVRTLELDGRYFDVYTTTKLCILMIGS